MAKSNGKIKKRVDRITMLVRCISQLFLRVNVSRDKPSPNMAHEPSRGAVKVKFWPYAAQYSDLIMDTNSNMETVMVRKLSSSVL